MVDIPKKIVTDEEGTPVAVQIEYADWKRLEEKLQSRRSPPSADESADAFERALNASRNTWTAGDGLEYQRRIRSEWNRREETTDHNS